MCEKNNRTTFFFIADTDYIRHIVGNTNRKEKYVTCNNGLSPFMGRTAIDRVCYYVFHSIFSRYFPEFIKKIFYSHLAGLNSPKNSIYVISRGDRLFWEKGFLKYVKKKRPDIILCAWILDLLSLHPVEYQLDLLNNYYDYTITYDSGEAAKYGFYYIETPYTGIEKDTSNNSILYDVVFVGKSKISLDETRYNTIISVFKYLKANGLKPRFYITDVPEEFQISDSDIVYNHPLTYCEIIQLDLQSRCILDVPQKDEVGTTLRIFEAIKYDRKFIFCNPNLKNHKYYDERYMKFFNKVEEIDISFICENISIQYDNKELLSVNYFIDSLKTTIDKNEKTS